MGEHRLILLGDDAILLVEVGVRVLGLSNWSAETFHVAGSKAPVVTMLEAVLVSRVGSSHVPLPLLAPNSLVFT